MAKPRVFISSTYKDLIDIRSDIANFVNKTGFEPISFENNDIAFSQNKSLEEDCYDEVKKSSMLILIIRNRLGSLSSNQDKAGCHYNSITRSEYITAQTTGIPIFIFIHNDTHNEYRIFKKQNKNDFVLSSIDNIGLFMFIDEIYKDSSFRFIHTFKDTKDILLTLKKQWAGLFNKYLENEKSYASRAKKYIYINSFKFFFFRKSADISQEKVAKRANLKISLIQKIEDAGIKKSHIDIDDFVSVTHEEAQRIADGLGCGVGNIKAGLPDDFLSQYLVYYFKNKGTRQRKTKKNDQLCLFSTKVVLFDFDGTMTKRNNNLSSWERIWIKLGYDINDCANLHKKFSSLEITHKEWCKKTEKKFKEKRLKNTDLDQIANDIQLIDGVEDVITKLYSENVKLYIVSGSVKYLIRKVLGHLFNYFEAIKANEITFDKNSYIKSIIGTKFDFEGKRVFIDQAIDENSIHPMEALYIGNSVNDEWAHESGVQTLCVNPRMTNPYNPIQWMYCIQQMDNFENIMKFINLES